MRFILEENKPFVSIMPSHSRNEKGFTLIELIVVLAIMAVISGVVTISSSSVEKRKLLKAAITLQSDLRFLQRSALSDGTRYMIALRKDKNDYVMYKRENNNFVRVKTVEFPSGITLDTANKTEFEYTPKGTVSTGGSIILGTVKYSVTLTITPAVGRILVKDIDVKL